MSPPVLVRVVAPPVVTISTHTLHSLLQRTATHCNALQHTAQDCKALSGDTIESPSLLVLVVVVGTQAKVDDGRQDTPVFECFSHTASILFTIHSPSLSHRETETETHTHSLSLTHTYTHRHRHTHTHTHTHTLTHRHTRARTHTHIHTQFVCT